MITPSKNQLVQWLQHINEALNLVGRKRMTKDQVYAFAVQLEERNYTFDQCYYAQIYFLFGKWRHEHACLCYFFPLKKEIQDIEYYADVDTSGLRQDTLLNNLDYMYRHHIEKMEALNRKNLQEQFQISPERNN